MSKQFLDTNVIVYANDERDRHKHERAIDLVTRVIRERSGVISTQVLQEYAAVAVGKLHQDPDVVQRQLLLLEAMEIVPVTPTLIRRALELQVRYQVNFWDASILAAAELSQCSVLFSEDLNAGQVYANVRIESPFSRPE